MKQYIIMVLSSDSLKPLDYKQYDIKRSPYEDEFFDSEEEAVEFIEKYLTGFREDYIILPAYIFSKKKTH